MVQAYTASALKRQLNVSQVYTVSRFRLNGELLFQKQNTKKTLNEIRKKRKKTIKLFLETFVFLKFRVCTCYKVLKAHAYTHSTLPS